MCKIYLQLHEIIGSDNNREIDKHSEINLNIYLSFITILLVIDKRLWNKKTPITFYTIEMLMFNRFTMLEMIWREN